MKDIDLHISANNHMAAMPFQLIKIHGAVFPGEGGRESLTLLRVQWSREPELCSLSEDIDPDGRNRRETLYCQA